MPTIREICTKPDGTVNERAADLLNVMRDDGDYSINEIIKILDKLSHYNLTLQGTPFGTNLLHDIRQARQALTTLHENMENIEFGANVFARPNRPLEAGPGIRRRLRFHYARPPQRPVNPQPERPHNVDDHYEPMGFYN